MADDDIIRSMLERDARLVPTTLDARIALDSIGPALRRSTMKRTSVAVASTALLFGGAVAAVAFLRPAEDQMTMVSTATRPSAPPIATLPTTGSVDRDTAVPATTDDPSIAPSPIEHSDVDTGPNQVAPTTATAAVEVTAPPTTPAGTVAASPPAPTPPKGTEPTTVAPATTVPIVVPPQVVVYDSPCGSVRVDVSTTPPTIIEISAAEGYQYLLEDHEGDSIHVHFTGGGDECEVEVGEHPNSGDPDRVDGDGDREGDGDAQHDGGEDDDHAADTGG